MRISAAIVTAVLILMAPAPAQASAARADLLVSATDAPGDVQFYPTKGLTDSERRSIDLREVAVVAGKDIVRFKVRVRSILKTQKFDQMVFIDMSPTAASGSTWSATIGMSPQAPTASYAYLFFDDSGTDYRSCDPLPVTVLRRKASIRIDVPLRCIPQEDARIKITSDTGFFRSDAGGPWSKDAMRVPGAHRLR